MTAPFTVLSDADIAATAPTEAQLQAAIAAVCAMSTPAFVKACAAVGRQVHLDPDGVTDFLAGRL